MANTPDAFELIGKIEGIDDRDPGSCCMEGGYFEILVKGQLNSDWEDWFDGMVMKLLEHGEMSLAGRIVDQPALMGILNKLNRLNMTILSFRKVE